MEVQDSRVGQFRIDVAFEQATDDVRQRRTDAITRWLLSQFEQRRREADEEHRSAG